MNKKKKILIAFVLTVILILLLVFKPWKEKGERKESVQVIKGAFETYIVEIGELKASRALDIAVPNVFSKDELDVDDLDIIDLVEEGKLVKKGDHVATLDPTEVVEKINSVDNRLDEYYNSLESAKLDSSLTLSAARDAIQKAKDLVLDKEIKVEQSMYESKAFQRQAGLELEQANRSLVKSKREIEMRRRRLKVSFERFRNKIERYEYQKKLLLELKSELDIKSPASGMVVYGYGHRGRKIRVGSEVGRWRPLIATLPDLSSLMSEIYVKEVNISKIKLGDEVRVTVDIFTDKKFTGEIIKIANIGQEIPGEYQNGFKVEVRLDPFHVDLLPNMTTSNVVITGLWEDALMISKRAVFGNDSLRYVMKKSGLNSVKQKVELG